MPLEIERKYLDVDFAELSRKLHSLGFREDSPHFESNVILDGEGAPLYASGRLLRLRKTETPAKTLSFITYKTPPPLNDAGNAAGASGSADENGEKGGAKIKEELETETGDFETTLAIFLGLGYKLWAKYEKIRQVWHFPQIYADGEQDGVVKPELTLDILPFARVVEMEGPEAFMNQMERLLGLDKFEKSTTNYHKLHQKWRAANSLPPQRDFIFEKSEREMWRRKLGLSDKA